MKGFLFIGDVFINTTAPGRRIDQDFFSTVKGKLKFCMNLAEEKELVPVITGQMFYKTFDIKALTEIIPYIRDSGIHVLPSSMDWNKKKCSLLSKSTLGILSATGILNVLCDDNNLELDIDGSKFVVTGNSDISIDNNTTKILVMRSPELDEPSKIKSFDTIGNSSIIVNAGTKYKSTVTTKNALWNNIGPLVRAYTDNEEFAPTIHEWTPNNGFKEYVVPHEKHVMDHTAVAKNVEDQNLVKSDFAKLMKEEMLRLQQENDTDLIETELTEILISTDSSPLIKNQIEELQKKVESQI